jgi:DNA-directed RNA polymerase subunit RPC12/RpoP
MPVDATTAEWNCTRCGTTNRKLVPISDERSTDRCTHCGTRHVIEPNSRRVRWLARLE